MRILFIGDPLVIHTKRWLEYFSKKGYEIHLAGTKSADDSWPSEWRFHHLGSNFPGEVPKWVWRMSNYVRGHKLVLASRQVIGYFRLRKLIRRIDPDILHVHYIDRLGIYALLSGFHPVVATAWGSDIYVAPRTYNSCERFLLRKALSKADTITADAENLIQEVIALGGRAETTHLIQWGVDRQKFRPGIDFAAVKRKWQVENEGPIVLSARHIIPRCNIGIIFKAFSCLLTYYPEAILIQLGHHKVLEYSRYLEELVKELGISERIKWTGFVNEDELAMLYNLADVTVTVPTTDSTPVTLLEAMACGSPVILSDLPASREWIVDHKNGWLVPIRDEERLADALVRCLETSKVELEQIRSDNLDLVASKADRNMELGRMDNLYRILVDRNRRA